MIKTTVDTETLTDNSGISMPPGTIVGYRANGEPIYNIAGGDGRGVVGAESDDDDDDDDTDDVEEQDDDSKDEENEWVPPTKEDFDKLLAAKQKADSEAAARKRFLREAGFDPKTGKPLPKNEVKLDFGLGTDDEDTEEETAAKAASAKADLAKQQRDLNRQLELAVAKTEQNERRRAQALIAAVPETLEEAGWNGKNIKRMMRLLDLDSVEVDSDGEVEGLREQVESLRGDFPEFFKRTRMREAAKEVADTKTVGGGAKKAPASEETLDFATRLKQQLYKGNA